MFKNFKDGVSDLAWTLGGTGLVLITLSGDTKNGGSGYRAYLYLFMA